MKGIKKLLAAGLAGLLLTVPVGAEETTWEEIPNANIPAAVIQKEVAEAEGMQVALSLPVKSAILIDQNTGTVRYEMNADEKLLPRHDDDLIHGIGVLKRDEGIQQQRIVAHGAEDLVDALHPGGRARRNDDGRAEGGCSLPLLSAQKFFQKVHRGSLSFSMTIRFGWLQYSPPGGSLQEEGAHKKRRQKPGAAHGA